MDLRPTFLAATLALATLGAAHADGLRPIEARSIDLGAVTGTAYYTVDPDGYRVVATVAQGAAGTPVRFEAVLSPGQTVRLSTPGEVGRRRRHDRDQPPRRRAAGPRGPADELRAAAARCAPPPPACAAHPAAGTGRLSTSRPDRCDRRGTGRFGGPAGSLPGWSAADG